MAGPGQIAKDGNRQKEWHCKGGKPERGGVHGQPEVSNDVPGPPEEPGVVEVGVVGVAGPDPPPPSGTLAGGLVLTGSAAAGCGTAGSGALTTGTAAETAGFVLTAPPGRSRRRGRIAGAMAGALLIFTGTPATTAPTIDGLDSTACAWGLVARPTRKEEAKTAAQRDARMMIVETSA